MKGKHNVGVDEFLAPFARFVLLLVLYQILRLVFYAFNASLFPHVTSDSFPMMMLGGMRFDVSALVYLNLLYFVVHFLSFRAKFGSVWGRVADVIFLLFNTLGVASCCIDFIYYRFILRRTTFGVLDILANEQNMGSLWLHFLADYWYVFLLFLLFIGVLVIIVRLTRPRRSPLRDVWPYATASVLVFALTAALSVAGIRGGFLHSTRPITMSNAAAYTQSPEEAAIVLNTPFCFIRTIGKKSFSKERYFADDELAEVYTPVHPSPVDSSAMTNRRNVVIFIMESFSREFLGSFNPSLEGGKYKGYTPFLDSLSRHSLVFVNAYANGRKSIDAMPSVLASLPSLTMPYVVSQYSNDKVNGIAGLLGREGYSTAFFHGAANGSMGFDGFAKHAGFDRYYGRTEYANDDDYDGIWGIWDHKFFQFYEEKIGEMPEPFCCALFSLSSHDPFKVPQEFEGRFPKGKLPVEECVGYSDYALRCFFDNAKQEEWYRNTLFVITADHSSIPDHDEYRNNAQAFAVPIIFFAPGDDAVCGRDSIIAQQADIMPSILGYLGYNHPFVAFGRDLRIAQPDSVREAQNRFALNYNNDMYQLLRGDTIVYFDGKKLCGVYDMKSDPALTRNLLPDVKAESHDSFVRAYVQQYNYRMIGDSLTVAN